MEIQENCPSVPILPTEILHHIFQYLPATELIKCRQVSVFWKQIAESEDIWREFCKREHRNAFEDAILKCRFWSWRSLYKSLSLWPQLNLAKETQRNLTIHNETDLEIRGVNVRNGIAAVHRAKSIQYYDLESFELIDYLKGDYRQYEENDDVLALMHHLSKNDMERDDYLRIIRKVDDRPIFSSVVKVSNVTNFKIVGQDVYYVKAKDDDCEIYVCKRDNDYNSSFILRIHEDVWGFRDHGNKFEVLTKHFGVYELNGSELVCTQYYNMRHSNSYLNELVKYNYLDYLYCFRHYLRRCIAKAYDFNPPIDIYSSILNTTNIKVVNGNMLLVGDKFGVLKIHFVDSDSFDPNCPAKQYVIGQTINGIEVVEIRNGHIILISTPLQVMTIKLEHNVTL